MLVAAIHLKIRDAKLTNQSGAGDERLAARADWLTDRYDTYHLRMWLIYAPTKNCNAPQDCNADVVRTAQQIDEGTRLWRKGKEYGPPPMGFWTPSGPPPASRVRPTENPPMIRSRSARCLLSSHRFVINGPRMHSPERCR